MPTNKTRNRETGNLGETVACTFLVKRGFSIVERNYWKKWGEIDIIARKDKVLHFIEVKSVSCETFPNVSAETTDHRPEDNVHPLKLARLARTIQTYIEEREVSDETDWQIDVMTVYLNMKTRKGRVKIIENIII